MRAVIVCGAVMVKDEAVVIERCLRSLAQFCDRIVLLDTGSIDDTLSVAHAVLTDLEMPFAFLHCPFDNFAASRTFLVKHARQESDWVLMVDADMTLSGEGRPELPDNAEVGLVEFLYDGTVSQRGAYLRSAVEWRYEGELHEYATADLRPHAARVRGLVLKHHGKAGQRRGAVEDLAVLERLAAQYPLDPRWRFYVAQTLKMMGRRDDAIAAYRECAVLGQPEQEWFWYSMYQAAVLARDPQALYVACQMREYRAEGWYALACMFAELGRYDAALPFVRIAASLGQPDDVMFVNRAVYHWGARLELATCLAATGEFAEALECARFLMHDDGLPEVVRHELNLSIPQWEAAMVAV